MIATIVCSILVILAVLLIIVAFMIDNGSPVCASIILLCIVALVLPISLVNGKSLYKQDMQDVLKKYLVEKEEIEYILENHPSMYIIDQAKAYNSKIEVGNNYWCRFNIEDRSEYLIDIDYYINSHAKD